MHLNTFIETSEYFYGVPSAEFLEKRDAHVFNDERQISIEEKYRRWDAEWPEYHQCSIDPTKKIYRGRKIDLICETHGRVDYKQYAANGIHVSTFVQGWAKDETGAEVFTLWKWAYGNNRHIKLEKNKSYGYEIIGHINAKYALDLINEKTNRFKWPPENPLTLDEFL